VIAHAQSQPRARNSTHSTVGWRARACGSATPFAPHPQKERTSSASLFQEIWTHSGKAGTPKNTPTAKTAEKPTVKMARLG